jgi:hypothetical protein
MNTISSSDRAILRDVAKRVVEFASDPLQDARLAEWKRHNAMRPGKPMVLVYPEDVWDEFLPMSHMDCEGDVARSLEWHMRAKIYHAEHLRDDRPINADYEVGIVIDDPGCGIHWNYSRHDVDGHRRTEGFEAAIKDDADPADIIHNRAIHIDWDATRTHQEQAEELFGDIFNVKVVGRKGFCLANADLLLMWRGIENLMTDMVDRPAWVHEFFARMTESEIDAARQIEAAGALSLNNGADGVGSGGIGATDELPGELFDGKKVHLRDMWGNGMSQIFSEVSPAMHEEFAIPYEAKFMDLFGLNCYGCCEPLDQKMHLVKQLPRMRRVSMSPFVDWVRGAEAVGDSMIYSAKPQPSYLATDVWDVEVARAEIRTILDACKTNGCQVEFVLNSTLTSNHEPHRYDEWTDMVQRECREYAESL